MKRIIPNLLTLSRLIFCPAVIVLCLQGKHLPAIGLFVLAAATDYLDGYLARRLNARTGFGALFDPICDKATTIAFFSLLMAWGSCPQWFLALFIAIALLQGLAFFALKGPRHQGISFEPLPLAKWSTALQLTWIGIVLCDFFFQQRFPQHFRFSMAFHLAGYSFLASLQVVVFFQYCFRYRPFLFSEFRALSAKSP